MDTGIEQSSPLSPGSLGAIFDPLSPDQIEDPYPLYARARREEPVFYSTKYDVWVVTRYQDLSAVLRDTTRFSSVGSLEAKTELSARVRAVLSEGYVEFLSLVQSDPPDHTRIRNVFNKALSAQRVAAMEENVRTIAADLLEGFVRDGEADLVTRFAYPLPIAVICSLLGVPRADLAQIKLWSNGRQVLLSAHVPEDQMVDAARDFLALQRYFREHIEARVKSPQDDLLTLLVPAEIGGTAPLSMQEAVSNAIDLLAAGHETTTDLIGSGMALLMAHPDQMAQLRADPGLMPAAIDEILRMEAPVRGLFRRVTAKAEVGGVTIPEGARLFLLYGSGNRDESEYTDAERFDIHLKVGAPHLAFSKGIHYCVGNALARLEGRVAFELLLSRLPGLRRHPTLKSVRRPYLILRGFEHLPVQWDASAGA